MRYNIPVLEPHLISQTASYDIENIIVDDERIPVTKFR